MLTRRAALQAPAALCAPALLIDRVLADEPVETDLVLAADVSGSMNDQERKFRREAYMHALASPDVRAAIRSTPNTSGTGRSSAR